MLCALDYSPIARISSAWKESDMTELSNSTKKPTREELTAILSGSKDVTKPGSGVVIVGGVQPPRMPEGLPHEKSSPSTNARSVKRPEGTVTGDFRAQD